MPEPKFSSYDLIFRNGANWVEIDTGETFGEASARAVSFQQRMVLSYSNGIDYLELGFNFAADLNLYFDGTTMTGFGQWNYTSTAEVGVIPPKTVPDMPNTLVLFAMGFLFLWVSNRRIA